MYVKALAILLLLSGLVAGIWKLYDAGGDAREDRITRKWAEEKLALIAERDDYRQKAEAQISEDRIIYRDRIQRVRDVVTDCTLPAVHIGVLRESGVFKTIEVRDTPNN
jgi:hypothetical protein